MIREFLTKYGFPKSAADFLSDAYDKLSCSKSFEAFHALISQYETEAAIDFDCVSRILAEIGKQTGIHPYTLTTLWLISMTPHLKKLYSEHGYSMDIYDRSVLDIRWKVMECYNVYGIYGTFVGHWTADFFRLKRFGIGRLEFNLKAFDFDGLIGEYHFKAGDQYVQVHIPSAGPLIHDECIAAYAAAADFFKDHFSDSSVLFGCKSWLLSPNLQSILSPDSHILQFASDWTIVRNIRDPQNKNLWRIFGCKELPPDVNLLPQETSLQHTLVEWLKSGGTIDNSFGVIVMRPQQVQRRAG